MDSPWAIPLHLLTAVSAITVFVALWLRRYRVARVAVGLQVSLIFWGWALAQYPFLLPPSFTIRSTAAPHSTLRLTLIVLLVGGAVLLPSLWYLFQVFKTAPADASTRDARREPSSA